MKKRIVLFSLVVLFTTLCAGLFAHTGNTQSLPDRSLKNKILQKSDGDTQLGIYVISDIQDEADSDDLEKVKLDYSLIIQEYLHYFFDINSFSTQSGTIRNHYHIAVPRYILYHSLQVADC